MKKNRGFVLIETLISSTVVTGILIYIFIQFNKLQSNYNTSFKINDVDCIYRISDIKKYINSLNNNSIKLITDKISSDNYIYLDYNDSTLEYNNINYLDNQNMLLYNLDIKSLIIANSNIDLIDTSNLSNNLKKIIKKTKNNSDNYKMIAEFNNGEIAFIDFDMGVNNEE